MADAVAQAVEKVAHWLGPTGQSRARSRASVPPSWNSTEPQKKRAWSDNRNATKPPISSAACQWLTLLLIIGAVILFPERPAWGGEFEVNANSDGVSGFSRGMPLGLVLETLANQTGFEVYIDEKLINVPATFTLPVALPAEKAIQRMVHPHSYAMVFTKLPDLEELAVDQVKVYAKGDHSASFVKISKDQQPIAMAGHARGGYVRSDGRTTQGVRSGESAVRQHVKAPVRFRENAMGFTGFDFKDMVHAPDYRIDALAMGRNYRDYRLEREAYALRAKDAQMQAAKQNSNNRQNAYHTQRQSSIQQTVNQGN